MRYVCAPARSFALSLGIIALIGALLPAAAAAEGADNWIQIHGAPFDSTTNPACNASRVMDGFIYIGVAKIGGAGAQVWRSAIGESGTWTQMTITPALTAQNSTILDFYDTGGIYYFTTGGSAGSAKIFRSTNSGLTWTIMSGPVSGFDTTGNSALARITSRGDSLYVGTQNKSTGAQLWRIRYSDTIGWQKVIDARDTGITRPGFENVSQLWAFKDTIYTAFEDTTGGPLQPCQVYQSTSGDSLTWTKVQGIGNGFGDVNNVAIAAAADFNGYLYFTTNNREGGGGTGGQLWRSSDGNLWSQINGNAFGHPKTYELHHITVAGTRLWLTTRAAQDQGESAAVYRSTDGINWLLSNAPGFGDSNNASGAPTVAVLGDSVF